MARAHRLAAAKRKAAVRKNMAAKGVSDKPVVRKRSAKMGDVMRKVVREK